MEITEEDFLTYSGRNLEKWLPFDDLEKKAAIETLVNRAYKRVVKETEKRSLVPVDETKLTTSQLVVLKDSVMEYMLFILTNGDAFATNGRTAEGDTVEKFPSYIIEDLRRAGIIVMHFRGAYYE